MNDVNDSSGKADRRSFLGAATGMAAGIALAQLHAPANPAEAAAGRDTASPAAGAGAQPGAHPHKFNLEGMPNVVTYPGGSAKEAKKTTFPILKGMALYDVRLSPGGVRVPHWHPNCAEMDYVIAGRARFSIVSNFGETHAPFEVGPGEIVFVPPAYFHYFENAGSEELHILVWFNNEMPDDIGLPEAMAGMPNGALAASLHTPDSQIFSTFSKSHDLIVKKSG